MIAPPIVLEWLDTAIAIEALAPSETARKAVAIPMWRNIVRASKIT